MKTTELTAVEWLEEKLKANPFRIENDKLWEQAKEMELDKLKEALEIIRKFVNEFDEEGEVSYNTRDEAEIFLTNQ
jgi:hypothetical protein